MGQSSYLPDTEAKAAGSVARNQQPFPMMKLKACHSSEWQVIPA
jgi:hypothetical protein